MTRPIYVDLHKQSEKERIMMVGKAAKGRMVNFVVETNAKADRYIAQLKADFPDVRVVERFVGPANTIVVKITRPGD